MTFGAEMGLNAEGKLTVEARDKEVASGKAHLAAGTRALHHEEQVLRV